MDNMKCLMGKVRRRRLALFLVFVLMIGIMPKATVKAAATPDDGWKLLRALGGSAVSGLSATVDGVGLFEIRFDSDSAFDTKYLNIVNTNGFMVGGATASNVDATLNSNSGIKDLEANDNVVKARGVETRGSNSYITAFSQVIELYKALKTFKEAITAVDSADQTLIANKSASNAYSLYGTFCTKFETARSALSSYQKRYSRMAGMDVFSKCLNDPTDSTKTNVIRDARILSEMKNYRLLENKYEIEKAYFENLDILEFAYKDSNTGAIIVDKDSVEFFEKIRDAIKNPKNDLKKDGNNAYDGEAMLTKLYNGSTIKTLLENYDAVSAFRAMLDAIPDMPQTQSDMEAVGRARTYLNNLEKNHVKQYQMVSEEDKERLELLEKSGTDISELNTLISELKTKYPKNGDEKSYKAFETAYLNAYTKYEALKKKYPSVVGLDKMITDIDLLKGEIANIYKFTTRINEALALEDWQVCDSFNTMIKPIVDDYAKLDNGVKNNIYNYASFYTNLYLNAKEAYDMRVRIDKLNVGLLSQHAAEVEKLIKDVEKMNERARKYLGETYIEQIHIFQYNIYIMNGNEAGAVSELIEMIGTVGATSGKKIKTARNAYDSLTADQQLQVSNYSKLIAAEEAYNKIKNNMSNAIITNVKTGYVYTRAAIKPKPTVIIDDQILTKGVDYTVSYSSNKSVGTARLTITAISGSGYSGSVTKTFKIVKDSISDGSVSGVAKSYKYTGKKIKPVPKLKVFNNFLTKGKDFTVTYKNNKKKGTATIILKGKGNYKGTKKKTFKIVK